jgi:CubicO group peptidase (beta-lactamase class C family)
MYITAAHIISTYASSFTTFAKARIFDPLNMTSTTYSLSEAVSSGQISQAWTSIGNGRRIPHWFDDELNQLVAGAGGIISSATDMVCDVIISHIRHC